MISYSDLPGAVSANALSEHKKLYEGYQKMLGRADVKLVEDEKPTKPSLDSDFAASLKNHSYALGGVLLHELFFSNLSLSPKAPSESFLRMVEDEFGSIEYLTDLIISTGLSCRGWAILAQSVYDGSVRIFSMDSHDTGSMFGFMPLLVIDVWEHAYWMDWGTNKRGYLDQIMRYVDWNVVSNRMK